MPEKAPLVDYDGELKAYETNDMSVALARDSDGGQAYFIEQDIKRGRKRNAASEFKDAASEFKEELSHVRRSHQAELTNRTALEQAKWKIREYMEEQLNLLPEECEWNYFRIAVGDPAGVCEPHCVISLVKSCVQLLRRMQQENVANSLRDFAIKEWPIKCFDIRCMRLERGEENVGVYNSRYGNKLPPDTECVRLLHTSLRDFQANSDPQAYIIMRRSVETRLCYAERCYVRALVRSFPLQWDWGVSKEMRQIRDFATQLWPYLLDLKAGKLSYNGVDNDSNIAHIFKTLRLKGIKDHVKQHMWVDRTSTYSLRIHWSNLANVGWCITVGLLSRPIFLPNGSIVPEFYRAESGIEHLKMIPIAGAQLLPARLKGNQWAPNCQRKSLQDSAHIRIPPQSVDMTAAEIMLDY